MGMKTKKTKKRARAQRCTAFGVALALTVAAFVFGNVSSDGALPATHSAGVTTILHSLHQVGRVELSALYREQTAIHELSRYSTALPTCPAPQVPAPTQPPG